LGDQATVPPHDGTGGDEPVCPQLPGQEPDPRGHDGPAGPAGPGALGLARRQHGAFMPQD